MHLHDFDDIGCMVMLNLLGLQWKDIKSLESHGCFENQRSKFYL